MCRWLYRFENAFHFRYVSWRSESCLNVANVFVCELVSQPSSNVVSPKLFTWLSHSLSACTSCNWNRNRIHIAHISLISFSELEFTSNSTQERREKRALFSQDKLYGKYKCTSTEERQWATKNGREENTIPSQANDLKVDAQMKRIKNKKKKWTKRNDGKWKRWRNGENRMRETMTKCNQKREKKENRYRAKNSERIKLKKWRNVRRRNT